MGNRGSNNRKKPVSPDEEPDQCPISDAEIRYRAIFEQSPYGILIIDTNGVPLEFNEETHNQLGYTREEFARLRISDIDPVQSVEDIQESIRRIMEEGKGEFDVLHRTKNGEMRNVHVITRVMNLSGRTVFQTIWQDVTEQKRAEEELSRYRKHLEELVKARTAELMKANRRLERDIEERRRMENEKKKLTEDLRKAFSEIRMLKGLIPVCAWCRKIRDDQGYWHKIERYIESHSDVKFTHGICPSCAEKIEKQDNEKV